MFSTVRAPWNILQILCPDLPRVLWPLILINISNLALYNLTSSFGEPDARGALERPTVNGVGVNRVAVYKGAVILGLTVYNIIL